MQNNDTTRYLQRIKVDSFKLRMPIDNVTVISSTFLQQYQRLYLTGEMDDTLTLENHKTNIETGITTRMGLVSCLVNCHERRDFLYIQVNSKMLKGKYLEGIILETIEEIYKYVISLGIVSFSYESFLAANVSDIDFAYDVHISRSTMAKINQKIYESVKPNKLRFIDKPFNKKDNTGIQLNTREKALPTAPFIKIYHKGLEFATKSKEFYDCYLSKYDLTEYGRLEYTIKGAKHQNHLGISVKTLDQLLNLDRDVIEGIVLEGISKNYIEPRKVQQKLDKSLTPTNKIILSYMSKLVGLGCDVHDLYAPLEHFKGEDATSRKELLRAKRLISSLIPELQMDKKLNKNKEIREVLRVLKIDL